MPATMTLTIEPYTGGTDFVLDIFITDSRPFVVSGSHRHSKIGINPPGMSGSYTYFGPDRISWSGNSEYFKRGTVKGASWRMSYFRLFFLDIWNSNSAVLQLSEHAGTNLGAKRLLAYCQPSVGDEAKISLRMWGGLLQYINGAVGSADFRACMAIPESIRSTLSSYCANVPTHVIFSFDNANTLSTSCTAIESSGQCDLLYMGGSVINPDARAITSADTTVIGDYTQAPNTTEVVIDSDGTILGLRNPYSYPNHIINSTVPLSLISEIAVPIGGAAPPPVTLYCDFADKDGNFISTSSTSFSFSFSRSDPSYDYYLVDGSNLFAVPSGAYFYNVRTSWAGGFLSWSPKKFGETNYGSLGLLQNGPYPRSPLWDISGSRVPAVLFPQ